MQRTHVAMTTINLRLYELFRKRFQLSDSDAREALIAVEEVIRNNQREWMKQVVTREFLQDELKDVKEEVKQLGMDQAAHQCEMLLVIYWTGMMLFLAIAVAVTAIVIYMGNQ